MIDFYLLHEMRLLYAARDVHPLVDELHRVLVDVHEIQYIVHPSLRIKQPKIIAKFADSQRLENQIPVSIPELQKIDICIDFIALNLKRQNDLLVRECKFLF